MTYEGENVQYTVGFTHNSKTLLSLRLLVEIIFASSSSERVCEIMTEEWTFESCTFHNTNTSVLAGNEKQDHKIYVMR